MLPNGLTFRQAEEKDIPKILAFIRELAIYEKMEEQAIATAKLLKEWLFEKKTATVFFAVFEGKEIGYSLFFHNFSTFLGKPGIYIEDLFILPDYRGRGFGRAFLATIAKMAADEGCGRVEWACLDWNKPSIAFYLSLGAEQLGEWTTYRLTGENLRKLAEGK